MYNCCDDFFRNVTGWVSFKNGGGETAVDYLSFVAYLVQATRTAANICTAVRSVRRLAVMFRVRSAWYSSSLRLRPLMKKTGRVDSKMRAAYRYYGCSHCCTY